jgi:ketosteroid isomerase-like protein
VAEKLPEAGLVHVSYGDIPIADYVHELAADHLIHSWDLAAATGGDTRLDPHLAAELAEFFAGREEVYRQFGVIGPRAISHGGAQSDLLAAAGRDSAWGPEHAALAKLSAAFGSGDVDAIMAVTADDCAFEATGPAPDGVRHEGAEAVRAVWEDLFAHTPGAAFTEEESFVCGDRGVLRWRFEWANEDGTPGHVRGTDVLRFRDGKVCEKFSYVKG